MKLDFSSDPQFAALFTAAVAEGVRAAMHDPVWRAELFAHVTANVAKDVWLTRAQVAEMCGGCHERTVARWAKKARIEVNDKVNAKAPLYRLSSVQEALRSGSIRAKPAATAAPVPQLNNHSPANGAPRRGISIVRAS